MAELLELLLKGEGYRVETALDGLAALDLAGRGAIRPDLLLSDYNLPNGMNGLELAAKLRETLRRHVPVIILTGDISIDALRNIAVRDCVQLNKPVKPMELTQTIQRLLAATPAAPTGHASQPGEAAEAAGPPPIIFIVDDDAQVRETMRAVLEDGGRVVETYATCEAFLEAYHPGLGSCLLIDAYLPGMSGLDLLRRLHEVGDRLPAIMITGASDVPMAVQAMKEGASDFIEKPIGRAELIAGIERALEQARDSDKLSAWRESAANHVASLTPRQRQIMDLVLAGHPSKNIAADLGISQRTVENHRASIMKRTGVKSLPALARLALAGTGASGDEPLFQPSAPPPRG
jgi:two-component system CheB/CheR fusion protein